MEEFYVIALNAEPWAIGPLGVARKNGVHPYIGPNQKLQAYQEALREHLQGSPMTTGEVEVRLIIWRQIESMKVYTGKNRKGKTSDATNIQKATEDALQGVLIENDRNVRKISTQIVSQKEDTMPCIVIGIKPYVEEKIDMPFSIWDRIEEVRRTALPNEGSLWSDDAAEIEDIF